MIHVLLIEFQYRVHSHIGVALFRYFKKTNSSFFALLHYHSLNYLKNGDEGAAYSNSASFYNFFTAWTFLPLRIRRILALQLIALQILVRRPDTIIFSSADILLRGMNILILLARWTGTRRIILYVHWLDDDLTGGQACRLLNLMRDLTVEVVFQNYLAFETYSAKFPAANRRFRYSLPPLDVRTNVSTQSIRQSMGVKPETCLILMTGAIQERKRFEKVIDYIRPMLGEEFILVVNGPFEAGLFDSWTLKYSLEYLHRKIIFLDQLLSEFEQNNMISCADVVIPHGDFLKCNSSDVLLRSVLLNIPLVLPRNRFSSKLMQRMALEECLTLVDIDHADDWTCAISMARAKPKSKWVPHADLKKCDPEVFAKEMIDPS